ncbi:hypothetical protein EDB86DRAFT_680877 [Lactarius hatsudake]|nr:hypothetical protein EDB86DRAFT_680877 [Lactarius hatsudake]
MWLFNDGLFQYIQRVVEDRSSLYGGTTPMIRSIDVIENGVLLVVDLHRKLGDVAFLKRPNYGLDPTDIPRVESSDRQGDVKCSPGLKEPFHLRRRIYPYPSV